jgi:hypothetical protein
MHPLNIGATKLEKIAVLDFLSAPVLVNVVVIQLWG